MAITSIVRDLLSNYIVRVTAENTLAEVAAANYIEDQIPTTTALNHGAWEWQVGDMVLVAASDGDQFFEFDGDDFSTLIQLPGGNGEVTLPVVDGDFTVFDGTLGALKDAGYSASDATKTKVVMAGSAVVVNRLAHFVDTDGTIDDTAANVTNLGNILAGASGTAGTLTSFPATAANGSLIVAAINAGGAFNTTISNSVMGQSSVISIPDPGAATANFILSASAGTQHITSGSLQVDAGSLIAGLAAGGTAGRLTLFPVTAANGSIGMAASNAGADFDMTITNSTLGQDSSIVIVDPANANARFLIGATATPFVSGNFPVASGTGGLMVDSGMPASEIQNNTNIIADTTADIGGAGAGPISVVVANLTAASPIVATIASSSNAVAVAKCIGTATGFDITFTADPGAACVVNYVAFVVAQ